MHRYRPKFLASSCGLPSYYDPYEFRHECLLECQPSNDSVDLPEENESNEMKKCIAMPFVSSHQFQSQSVAEKFANAIKEVAPFACPPFFPHLIVCSLTCLVNIACQIRVQHAGNLAEDPHHYVEEKGSHFDGEISMCRFFVQGFCNRGNDCLFSHSLQARRPVCKFFASLQVLISAYTLPDIGW